MKKNVLTVTAVLLTTTLTTQASAAGSQAVNTALASQPRAFIAQSSVKPRLNQLMGLVNAGFLRRNFSTTSTLQNTGDVIAVTGCRPHDCANNGSLVAYDTKHNAFKVWLTVNGKTRIYTDKGFSGVLNSDTQVYISNLD